MKFPIHKLKRLRRTKPRKPIPRVVVPSFFTLMNLFSGFLSIIMVADGNLILGAWLIVVAGLFDALDGFVARLANATSEFGMELDSISDVVSFGVAPGFLIYHFALSEYLFLGILLAALPPLCGAVRLARFNVSNKHHTTDHFVGLPIPAQAAMLAGFTVTFIEGDQLFPMFEHGVVAVLTPVVILLSFLMVSTVPFDKIPRFDTQSIRANKGKVLLFLFYLLMIVIFQEYGLMIAFGIFIGKGLFNSARIFWENGNNQQEEYQTGGE